MTKPVFGVVDQVRHKPGCTTNENGQSREISDLERRDCTICVSKTKALIGYKLTAQLICALVFAYAKIRFYHDGAHTESSLV